MQLFHITSSFFFTAADGEEDRPVRRQRKSEPGASSPEPMPGSASDGQRLVYLNADKHPVPSL